MNEIMTKTIYRIPNTRIIYINGQIDDEAAFAFNINMLVLESENSAEDITVYINSLGGSVSAGLSMIDTMTLVSCDVSTICVGMAASMGAMLLMAGTKGKRKILPNSSVLIHQPLGGFNGVMQASDVEIISKEMCRTKDRIYGLISQFTGKSMTEVEHDCDRDYTLYAQEAIDYGIVDSVLQTHKKQNM